MKKILIILITIPLIFGSCEKEENNNNSSLSLEQTIWELHSYSYISSLDGTLGPYYVPDTSDYWLFPTLEYVTWTFFENNGMFIQDTKFNELRLIDTNTYSYYPGLNRIISEYGNYLNEYNFLSFFDVTGNIVPHHGSGNIDIIQLSNNVLSCQMLSTIDEGTIERNYVFHKIQ